MEKITKAEATEAISKLPKFEKEFDKLVSLIRGLDKKFVSGRVLKYIDSVEEFMRGAKKSAGISSDYLVHASDENKEDQETFRLLYESVTDYAMVIMMLEHLYETANINAGGESMSTNLQEK